MHQCPTCGGNSHDELTAEIARLTRELAEARKSEERLRVVMLSQIKDLAARAESAEHDRDAATAHAEALREALMRVRPSAHVGHWEGDRPPAIHACPLCVADAALALPAPASLAAHDEEAKAIIAAFLHPIREGYDPDMAATIERAQRFLSR